jgi:hypothetical protein
LIILFGVGFLLAFSPKSQIQQLKQEQYAVVLEKKVVTLESEIESLQKEIDEIKKVVIVKGPNVEIKSQGKLEINSGLNMSLKSGALIEVKSSLIEIGSNSTLELLGSRINLGRGGVPALTLSTILVAPTHGGKVIVQRPSSTVFIKN